MSPSDNSYVVGSSAWEAGAELLRPSLVVLDCESGDVRRTDPALAHGLQAEGWPMLWQSLGYVDTIDGSGYVAASWSVRPSGPWTLWKRLVRLITPRQLVLIRSYSGSALLKQAVPALILARFFGKGVVLQLATPEFEEIFNRHRRWLLPVLRLADEIVTGSRYLERVLLRARLPVRRMVDPIATETVSHRIVSRLQPRILVDVDLEPYHQVGSALRAFRLVKQKYPRSEMVISGSGSDSSRLKRLAVDLNLAGVTFLNGADEVELTRLRSECDLYLNPSLQEESPSGMVRAMAAGLPVVCTDADGLLHMVRHGLNGLVVPMGDHVGLADAVIELVENTELTVRLSKEGLSEANRHSWPRVRQDWVNLFRRVGRKKHN